MSSDAPTGTCRTSAPRSSVPSTAGDPAWAGNSTTSGRPGDERADGRSQVGRRPGEGDVPEDQHVDDHRLEDAVADDRADSGRRASRSIGMTGPTDSNGTPAARWPGDRGEDVAAVEARRDDREHEVAVLDRARLDDPAEGVGGGDEQAVVRADERHRRGRPGARRATVRCPRPGRRRRRGSRPACAAGRTRGSGRLRGSSSAAPGG